MRPGAQCAMDSGPPTMATLLADRQATPDLVSYAYFMNATFGGVTDYP